MAKEKRVRDIVGFSQVLEVKPEKSIKEVVSQSISALKQGYSPVLLAKDGEQIVGMLCWEDLLSALVPSYAKGKVNMEIFWEGLFTDQWQIIAGKTVKDLMRPPITVDIDDTLSRVAYTLVREKVNSALVYDRGKMVGIVSTGDLFNQLLDSTA